MLDSAAWRIGGFHGDGRPIALAMHVSARKYSHLSAQTLRNGIDVRTASRAPLSAGAQLLSLRYCPDRILVQLIRMNPTVSSDRWKRRWIQHHGRQRRCE